jgi:argininosuccinate lyase
MSDGDAPLKNLHLHPSGVFTRLKKAPSAHQVEQYARFWPVHKPLFAEHLMLDLAWVTMMGERGIIRRDEAAAILKTLRKFDAAGADAFPYDPQRGDLYFNIESHVIDELGEALGGRTYTGRTRVDGEPTAKRLYLRRRLLDVGDKLLGLIGVCLKLAGQHLETVMPGYTGFQAGQPWTFGHFLLTFVDAFGRDFERLQGAYPRVNTSLLGGVVGSGSDLPFDRDRAAHLMGCDSLIENSRESCTSTDALAEVVAVCSILLAHVGQLSSDILTFCTQEFGMAELGDDFSSTSSFMPQKKNPNALYNIRATASGSVGFLPAVLSVMSTSSNDFDLSKPPLVEPVMSCVSETHYTLDYLSATMATLEFHRDLARDRALNMWTATSEIATLIFRERDVAWRTAHRITERFVRFALEEGLRPGEVTGELLDRAAQEIIGQPLGLSTEAVRQALDPMAFIRSRRTAGSPNPDEAARMLADRQERHHQQRDWVESRRKALASARKELEAAMDVLGGTL